MTSPLFSRSGLRLCTRRPGLAGVLGTARADALADLRKFVQTVRTGQADFTQVVSSPDGAKKRTSAGHFEFERPNRFRFAYAKPDEQLIVSDGKTVWLHDPDLNQVTQRPFGEALGATPAALLAGGSLDKDFLLKLLPDEAGLSWVEARPKGPGELPSSPCASASRPACSPNSTSWMPSASAPA